MSSIKDLSVTVGWVERDKKFEVVSQRRVKSNMSAYVPKNPVKPNTIGETLSENRWVSLGILILLVVQGKQCFLIDKRSEVIRSTQPTLSRAAGEV